MDTTIGASIVASVINSTSLNCRTNSSSSSSSSGYASGQSTASTPVTPISSHYDTSSTHSSTLTSASVSTAEQLPTATVAPVTPFYSEPTAAVVGQHQHQHQHQQMRQSYYHQSYPYSNGTAQYNQVYDAYTGNSYHNLTTPSVERTLSSSYNNHHNNNNNNSQQRQEISNKPNKTLSSHNNLTQQHYGTSSASATTTPTTTCATTKPQATATPFFAQPSINSSSTSAGGTAYYDAFGKYKMPSATKLTSQPAPPDYAANYTNHLQNAAAVATLNYQHQQQHYYAAAKSQLQDVPYAAAAAVVKPHRQHSIGNATGYHYGSMGSSSGYYDKYIYGPTASPAAYSPTLPPHAPPPHPYSPHEPTSADPYRKAAAAAAANAWHWNMEYAAATAGSCRSLPPSAAAANAGNYQHLSSPNGSNNGRNSFCATPAEKYGKYDKYGAYYASHHHPQQYMSTATPSTTSARGLWPNSQHFTPVPTILNERLPHTLSPTAPPQHQYPHSHADGNGHLAPFGATAASATTQRQNCCSQPYQQQTCYYPRPTQQYPHASPAAYPAATQSTHYGAGMASSSSSHKYPAYASTFKTNSNNDLYLTSPFDTPPAAAYNYGNASNPAMQQRYGSVTATGAPFYNDLNVQSAFETYAGNTISQSTMLPTHLGGTHNVAPHHATHHIGLGYQAHNVVNEGGGGNSSTATLLEYRKPISTTGSNEYCMSSERVPLTNLEQNTNTPSYLAYDIHGNAAIQQAHGVITSPTSYSDGGSSSEKSTPTTKNLSLRDFLATWNEEEEEDLNSANEQLAFLNENVENVSYVTETANVAQLHQQQQQQQQHQQQQPHNVSEQQFSTFKGSFPARPKIHVGITVNGPMDIDASQCVNLPDIIIDIEKSGNAGGGIVQSTTDQQQQPINNNNSSAMCTDDNHSSCGGHDLFESFDVEKELDELQIKRAKLCLEKQLNNEIRILTPEPIIESTIIANQEAVLHQPSPAKEIICNEIKQIQDLTAVGHNDYCTTDQILKNIELNDNNSHSSNSSTFEKEYETFINRNLDKVSEQKEQNKRKEPVIVAHQSTTPFNNNDGDDGESLSHLSSGIKTPPGPPIRSEETTLDDGLTTQNVQDFSMLYKKKRKLFKDMNGSEVTMPLVQETTPAPAASIATSDEQLGSLITDPALPEQQIHQRKLTKPKTKIFIKLKSKRRPRSRFYQCLRRRGRGRGRGHISRLNTSVLVQKHIEMLKERHLPLIKRQSFKNYATRDKIKYNPRSLMDLTISLVNTQSFQAQLLKKEIRHREREPIISRSHKIDVEDGGQQAQPETTLQAPPSSIENNSIETELPNSKEELKLTEMTKTKNDHLKQHLDETMSNSNSNSISENVSLNEQEDFSGFEENQTSRPSTNQKEDPTKPTDDDIEKMNSGVSETNPGNCDPGEYENHVESVDDSNENLLEESIPAKEEGRSDENMNGDDVDGPVSDIKYVEAPPENTNHPSETDEQPKPDEFSRDNGFETEICPNEPKDIREDFENNSIRPRIVDNFCRDFPESHFHLQTPTTLPAMRTKASVKMCDFSSVDRKRSSTKYRSKSESPTSEKSKKFKFQFNNNQQNHHPSATTYHFDNVDRLDKFKFVEKWTTSMTGGGMTGIAPDAPMKSERSSSSEALDLSSSSTTRRFEKPFHTPQPIIIHDDENSNSSTTSTSSSSSSTSSDSTTSSTTTTTTTTSTSSDDNEVSSLTTSASLLRTKEASASTTTTFPSRQTPAATIKITENHNISNDETELSEFKALERELSQHMQNMDWNQGEYDGTDSPNPEKTDKQNRNEIENANFIEEDGTQDIAELKKILESEHHEPLIDATGTIATTTTTTTTTNDIATEKAAVRVDMVVEECTKSCTNPTSNNEKPAIKEDITEAIEAQQALKTINNHTKRNEEENQQQQQHQQQQQQQPLQHVAVPKLSDLCKIALNSSSINEEVEETFYNNEHTNEKHEKPIPPNSPKSPPAPQPPPPTPPPATTVATAENTAIPNEFDERRELTVEEALAEMYRQVGVTSDPEDNIDDNHQIPSDNGENQAQDYLLINLAEILENSNEDYAYDDDDHNNVFVLQCDMNENLIRVMTATTTTTATTRAAATTSSERENNNDVVDGNDSMNNIGTLQLVQILNSNEFISNEEELEPALLQSNDENDVDVDDEGSDSHSDTESYSALNDLPIIHHEEIVPDNYKKFEKEQFLKYLHAKYVQQNVKKFHHANRILKKYRRRYLATKGGHISMTIPPAIAPPPSPPPAATEATAAQRSSF